MTNQKKQYSFIARFLGKRYGEIQNLNEQIRYLIMNSIFMVVVFPLVIIGITLLKTNFERAIIDFILALMCIISLVLMRLKVPLKFIPVLPVTAFGAYCIYLLFEGSMNLWVSVWILAFPLIVIYLCRLTLGLIESLVVLAVMTVYMYTPLIPDSLDSEVKLRFIGAYILITAITVIYELIGIKKDAKEAALKAELSYDNHIIQTMQDNIPHGIFMMSRDFRILPRYSKPLISILSYYDSELAGKSFLDILSSSLDAKQILVVKSYLEMIFDKSKSTRVLESVNPLAEFTYKIDDRKKTLSSSFYLLEEEGFENVIIGIIRDISREKGFEGELRAQKESLEREMMNMFDIIQIDPLVFQDFVDDAEANFKYINSILKDRSLTVKQVVTKFYLNIHAIKSNAMILGMADFARKLHSFEEEIQLLTMTDANEDDILRLVIRLDALMTERDNYINIVKRIELFKNSNKVDTILVHTMNKAVEKITAETEKKAELKAGYLDLEILESDLRRPIKNILFHCVRNSIYHGIESPEERIKKNKRPEGFLTFSIKKIDGKAELTFTDDGCGLDWDKIRKKYITKHPKESNPERKKLLSSIFSPGFTTAGETSLHAGRGSGLGLVKDIVKQYDGHVTVESSETGLTMKFTLALPK